MRHVDDPEPATRVADDPDRRVRGGRRSNFFVSIRRESCASPHYKFNLAPGHSFDWLAPHQPVARIGATLRLYHIPER